MSANSKALLETTQVAVASTTQYQPAAGIKAIIDKCVAFNSSTVSAATLTINLVPASGGASTANQMSVKTLQPLESFTFPEIAGNTLMSGDAVVTSATAATINLRISGREVS